MYEKRQWLLTRLLPCPRRLAATLGSSIVLAIHRRSHTHLLIPKVDLSLLRRQCALSPSSSIGLVEKFLLDLCNAHKHLDSLPSFLLPARGLRGIRRTGLVLQHIPQAQQRLSQVKSRIDKELSISLGPLERPSVLADACPERRLDAWGEKERRCRVEEDTR